MAHVRTRIEGFEWGTLTPQFDMMQGTSGTSGWTLSADARTGEYSLQIVPPVPQSSFLLCAHKFNADGTEDTTDYNAAAVRFYLKPAVLPAAGSERIFSLLGAGTERSYVTISSAGVLGLEGVAGTTTLMTSNWYRIELFYENGQATLLRLNGVLEITAGGASSGTVGQSLFGSRLNVTVQYTMRYDDFMAETSTLAANIDWPGSGQILRMDPLAEGTDTGWTVVGAADIPTAVQTDNGDTDTMRSTVAAGTVQTVTLQSSATAGISGTINAVQSAATVRRVTTNTNINMRTRQGATIDDTPGSNTTTSFVERIKIFEQDLLAADWTTAALDTLELGVKCNSAVLTDCSILCLQVDFSPVTVSTVFLEQLENLTGTLSGVTNYTPKIKTVKITSEHVEVPNQAINVVAVSLRYIPHGMGTFNGVAQVDQLTTFGFSMPANPLKLSNLGTTTDSTFTFGTSTMLDGEQIYIGYTQLGCSGKAFDLCLTQTGAQCWDILGLELELRPDGRRSAYLDGEF